MDSIVKHERKYACAGCGRPAFVLRFVDGARLCDSCAEKSERIDAQLNGVQSTDPVSCDGCARPVSFDARVAVVARECGGAVFCDACKATVCDSRRRDALAEDRS